jgi:hypothetical protein
MPDRAVGVDLRLFVADPIEVPGQHVAAGDRDLALLHRPERLRIQLARGPRPAAVSPAIAQNPQRDGVNGRPTRSPAPRRIAALSSASTS